MLGLSESIAQNIASLVSTYSLHSRAVQRLLRLSLIVSLPGCIYGGDYRLRCNFVAKAIRWGGDFGDVHERASLHAFPGREGNGHHLHQQHLHDGPEEVAGGGDRSAAIGLSSDTSSEFPPSVRTSEAILH